MEYVPTTTRKVPEGLANLMMAEGIVYSDMKVSALLGKLE
jgi:hypothetical protein